MQTTKQLLSLLLFTLLIHGCGKSAETEVSEVIGKFYSSSKMFRDVDRGLLSADLSNMVVRAREFEQRDAEQVRGSQFPTDKPHMIEGDIFTSLYEGQDGFRIKSINVNDASASVLVEFSNSAYGQRWEDQVMLTNEKGWKIDNVIFYEGRNGSSTKDVLKAFLQLEKRDFR
jgi:hypothetical protein